MAPIFIGLCQSASAACRANAMRPGAGPVDFAVCPAPAIKIGSVAGYVGLQYRKHHGVIYLVIDRIANPGYPGGQGISSGVKTNPRDLDAELVQAYFQRPVPPLPRRDKVLQVCPHAVLQSDADFR